MRPLPLLAALALTLGAFAAPAHAAIGDPLDKAIKINRGFKKDVMGVVYYTFKGKVGAEYWSSEMAMWDVKTADKLRLASVGKARKLRKPAKGEVVEPNVFKYTDGTVVRYIMRRGMVITMDVAGPGFHVKDVKVKDHGKPVPGKKWDKVMDWKEAPYKGKKW